jgi:hypothetical protein
VTVFLQNVRLVLHPQNVLTAAGKNAVVGGFQFNARVIDSPGFFSRRAEGFY